MATTKYTATVTKAATEPAVKDTEAKKTVTEEVKAETAKKKPATKKPAAKKPAAKKPIAKKTTTKATTSTKKIATELYVQFAGYEVSEEDLVNRVKEAWVNEGNKISTLKNINLYVKPEERKAYYVVNGSAAGALDI